MWKWFDDGNEEYTQMYSQCTLIANWLCEVRRYYASLNCNLFWRSWLFSLFSGSSWCRCEFTASHFIILIFSLCEYRFPCSTWSPYSVHTQKEKFVPSFQAFYDSPHTTRVCITFVHQRFYSPIQNSDKTLSFKCIFLLLLIAFLLRSFLLTYLIFRLYCVGGRMFSIGFGINKT